METKLHNNHKHQTGKLSLLFSMLCLVHCIATPLLFMVFPFLSMYFHTFHTTEIIILIISFSLGFYSLIHGRKYHYQNFSPLLMFSIGTLLIIGVHSFVVANPYNSVIMLVGGVLCAIGQLYNLKLSH
jgi:hypothetical protein